MLSARRSIVAGISLVLTGGVLTANLEAANPNPAARRPGCNSCGSSQASVTGVRATTTTTWAISLNSFQMGMPYRFPASAAIYSSMTYLPPSPVMSTYLPGNYPPVSYPYPPLSSGPLPYPQPPTMFPSNSFMPPPMPPVYPSDSFMPPLMPPVYPSNYFMPLPSMPFAPTFGPADYLPNTLFAMNQMPNRLPPLSYPMTDIPLNTDPAMYQPMPMGPAPLLPWPSQQLSSPLYQGPNVPRSPFDTANPYSNSPGHSAASLRWAQGP